MNGHQAYITASLLCADGLHLEDDLRELEAAQVDYLHVDMADGCFVPLLGIGIDLARTVRNATCTPFDVHLIVSNPDNWVPRALDELAPSMVTFHAEATAHSVRLAQTIRRAGVLAGVAINPGTPVCALDALLPEVDVVLVMTINPGIHGQQIIESTLEKITALRETIERRDLSTLISVDGNVSYAAAPMLYELGVDVYVCGSSSLFGHADGIAAGARAFRECLPAVQPMPKEVAS